MEKELLAMSPVKRRDSRAAKWIGSRVMHVSVRANCLEPRPCFGRKWLLLLEDVSLYKMQH